MVVSPGWDNQRLTNHGWIVKLALHVHAPLRAPSLRLDRVNSVEFLFGRGVRPHIRHRPLAARGRRGNMRREAGICGLAA